MEELRRYTEEEVDELAQWFIDHEKDLPPTIQLDKATKLCDVKYTVNCLIIQAKKNFHNPNLYGGIIVLEKVKKMIEGKG